MTDASFVRPPSSLPRGDAALEMIEDALDHLADGPRTSPRIVRRLLLRALDPGETDEATLDDVERFVGAYDRSWSASGAIPAPRREWSIVRADLARSAFPTDEAFSKIGRTARIEADGTSEAMADPSEVALQRFLNDPVPVEPDELPLMLPPVDWKEPLWVRWAAPVATVVAVVAAVFVVLLRAL